MRPFRDGDTYATLKAHTQRITAEIDALDNDYVLKASPTGLEKYFIEKALVRPLILHVDQLRIENQEGVAVDVSGDFRRGFMPGERGTVRGTKLDVAIPFEGDPIFWRVRASTFSVSGYPEITIRDDRPYGCCFNGGSLSKALEVRWIVHKTFHGASGK
jgi:hypothetical protein